ncbi:MAG: aspartyl/asparaginyl beta-hydroxylase domain-containing protein [Bacteroidetes bacterium]|nr:aspartyl/asparaginyl beta-hydroxylase domain-containing protein [Bacteroidota bacterium]
MKLWFSIFDRNEYNGNEPPFFNPTDYSFSKVITDNYPIIKKELADYLSKYELQSYFNSTMVAKVNTWKTVSLKTWNVEIYEHHKYFPETLKIIQSIPGLVSASFNLLEPHGHIVPHCGDTNGIFRCHLGLSIPGTTPACGFRVKNEWRSWEEGALLVFVDANNHEAINNTSDNRFIFLFDVVRDEVLAKKKWICATVLTSLFLQKWAEAIPSLSKVPLWLQKATALSLVPFAYLAIPVRNAIYSFKK